MNIKKQYKEIFEVLKSNENKKVSTILPQLIELMSAKQSQRNFITDEDGKVIAVFCYYHKKWELVDTIEYGVKKGTASGLNSMCKEGVRQWTRQQKVLKDSKAQLLNQLSAGEITVEELPDIQLKLEEQSKVIKPHSIQDVSFDSEEELTNYLNN